MKFRKWRKLYRQIFPVEKTEIEQFEDLLKSNDFISKYAKVDLIYELELLNGLKIFLRDQKFSDYKVFQQIFNHREYEIIVKIIKINQGFSKEKIIIDAGANVGYASIFFYNYLDSVRIIGVEPSYANLQIYEKNIKVLKASEKIKTYHRALSDNSNMNFRIDRDFRDRGDWAMTTTTDVNGEIKGITIDEIIKENDLHYISLLKIDIEGAERFIFKKGNNFSFLQKTHMIAIEIHDEFHIREKIYDILKSHGFFLFETGETSIGLNKRLFNKSD